MTLSDRAMQVAITGEVQEDDPHIIADLMAEIDRLRAALAEMLTDYANYVSTEHYDQNIVDRAKAALKEG